MKKLIVLVIIFLVFSGFAFAEEAGMEISVFIPESMYLYDEGTVAMTSGLSTSIGLGDHIEVPIGFDYCKLHGLVAEGVVSDGTEIEVTNPWYISDNFMPYLKLQANLALGPVILTAFGGGALSWNATLTQLAFPAADLAISGEYAAITTISAEAPFGYGWLAGASIGVKIDPVTVNIFAEYRDIRHPLTFAAEYTVGAADSITTQKTAAAPPDDGGALRMRGIACGIGGSFAF